MEVKTQSKLTFHGVDIINVNFIAFAPRDKNLQIDIKCEPKVFYPVDNSYAFKIIMEIELKDEKCFVLALKAIGNFELESDLDDELRKTFVNSNAPAIMFPYIRSFITTLTGNMGKVIGALVIPTHFFKGELDEFKE
ncbi:MAG: protein-export chaperone SecB [Bacteroidales bacterium]|jgi:preprotein translocase subunit SecB